VRARACACEREREGERERGGERERERERERGEGFPRRVSSGAEKYGQFTRALLCAPARTMSLLITDKI